MTQLEFFTQVIGKIWDGLGTITVPFLNISVQSLFLGVFVASFAVMILRPILGLGAGAMGTLTSGLRGRVTSARSEARQKRVAATPRTYNHYHYLAGGKKK